jgi:hypothetical protein
MMDVQEWYRGHSINQLMDEIEVEKESDMEVEIDVVSYYVK